MKSLFISFNHVLEYYCNSICFKKYSSFKNFLQLNHCVCVQGNISYRLDKATAHQRKNYSHKRMYASHLEFKGNTFLSQKYQLSSSWRPLFFSKVQLVVPFIHLTIQHLTTFLQTTSIVRHH